LPNLFCVGSLEKKGGFLPDEDEVKHLNFKPRNLHSLKWIKTIKHLVLLLFVGLALSGCSKEVPATSKCSSPDTQKEIHRFLTEKAEKLTAEKRDDNYNGPSIFGATKIRALLDQIQIAVENPELVRLDPNISKEFCSGLLKVTIPMDMLADVNQTRVIQHQSKISQYASQFNIENNVNVFTQDVEYTIQSSGDDKEPHVEIKSVAWVYLLDEITTSALLKPIQEVPETDKVQENKISKQEIERVKPETGQIKLETEKLKVMQGIQGPDKLDKELPEEQQVKKEPSQITQKPASQQAVPEALPPATTTKQFSPSFDCTKAHKLTDTTVCANQDLAALDIENMKRYKNAKAIDAVATKKIFKESIKSKYACGSDVDCIKKVYKRSIINYECVGVGVDNKLDCATDTAQ
jgi:hypothetical protein